jgi:hypothetical protein
VTCFEESLWLLRTDYNQAMEEPKRMVRMLLQKFRKKLMGAEPP